MIKKVLVVEDHAFCREIFEHSVLHLEPSAHVTGASSLREARSLLHQIRGISLVILDLSLPDSNGVSTVTEIMDSWPTIPVLVVSAEEDLQLQGIVKSLGAAGFVSKSGTLDDIRLAISNVLDGGTTFNRVVDAIDTEELATRLARLRSLTRAQSRVLLAMSNGALNKQIAHDLNISEITVKFHVKNILSKLNLPNRTSAVMEYKNLTKFL